MRKLLTGAVAALALLLTGAAGAGGWATVGLSPMPPDKAGAIWKVDLRVLQHGRTPLDGLQPTVTITNRGTDEQRIFTAKPTGKAGVYRAEVSFPSSGRWSYEVHDGFSRTHTFAPVTIEDGEGSSSRVWKVAAAAALGLALAALLTLTARRRRRLEPVLPATG